jgi:Acetylornithine deacetylase/Succinyl-diaminopimelate desuccinylase and related deacylases
MSNSPGIKYDDAIELLKSLISIPSFSKEEDRSADLIQQWLGKQGVAAERHLNNIWAKNKHFKSGKPTILLNSHHDTVKPNKGYSRDPFEATIIDDKLFGLGSNDAGGSLVSLLTTFCHFYNKTDLPFNLIMAATAEEEISGENGIVSLLPQLGEIDSAIVGEPTQMQMAVAERGLLVIDCIAEGKAGHAARNEGINSIYRAMMDIEWLYVYQFPKVSELLGPVKITVTSIETENKAHNVIPSSCKFIIDVRVNELYTLEEAYEIIQMNIQSKATPRSCRLRSTIIPTDHPLVKAGSSLGFKTYGSPTSSDKALMPFPALKIGPGDSARSHTADEFIYVNEIRNGIDLYIQILNKLMP